MDKQNVEPEGTLVQRDDFPEDAPSQDARTVAKPPINPFARLWAMGYRRLVPIVPPLAELSPHSSLFKRPGGRGKAVGELGPHGWRGFDWHKHVTTKDDLERWCVMGAGVGCRTGEGLVAIDIDTLDPELAALAYATALEVLGPAPRRIGRAPKLLLPYRVAETTGYQRVKFTGRDGKTEMVEMLSEGQQFVMGGIHPVTMEPYQWPDGLPNRDKLSLVSLEQLEAFFARLVDVLPEAVATHSSTRVQAIVDQDELVGDLGDITAVVAKIPNDRSDRLWHLRMSYGIKAALRDHPEEAFDLYWDWCTRWTVEGEPRIKEYSSAWSHWNTLHPPFTIGAKYLFDQAAAATGEHQIPAHMHFDIVPEGSVDTSAFSSQVASSLVNEQSTTSDTYALLDIAGLLEMPDPTYLIGRHIPETGLGFLYGDPGTGKSFIALDWALHIAFGFKTWHGDPINASPDAHVVYIAGEGVAGLKSRVAAWMRRHAVEEADARFSLLTHSVNMMDRDEVRKLARTIRAGAPGTVLVVVDTVSRSMPGADENQQKEMTRFVQACDAIRTEFQCVVLGVHHAARQGGNMRGSTVLGGAGDFIFKLERKPSASVGKLTCEKQKDAPDGWREPYRFDVVTYPGGTSLVPTRCLTADGDGAPVPAAQEDQILEAIDEAWRIRDPWGQHAQSGNRYAVTQLVKEFGFEAGRAQELIRTLQDQGLIAVDMVDRRTKKMGYRRLAASVAPISDGSVFD